jgi:hypothetical protein
VFGGFVRCSSFFPSLLGEFFRRLNVLNRNPSPKAMRRASWAVSGTAEAIGALNVFRLARPELVALVVGRSVAHGIGLIVISRMSVSRKTKSPTSTTFPMANRSDRTTFIFRWIFKFMGRHYTRQARLCKKNNRMLRTILLTEQ